MKYRYTRLATNRGLNDPDTALTHQVTFEAVQAGQQAMGGPMMGGPGFTIPMTEAEAAQLEMGASYVFALTKAD